MMILCRNEVLHTNRTPESSAFSRCAELARKSVMRKDITVYLSWIHSMSIIFQKSVPRVLEESVLYGTWRLRMTEQLLLVISYDEVVKYPYMNMTRLE